MDNTVPDDEAKFLPIYYVIDIETFQDRVYVLEERPGLNEQLIRDDGKHYKEVLLVKPREQWEKYFTNTVRGYRT